MENEAFLKKYSVTEISLIDLCLLKKCLEQFFLIKNSQSLKNFQQKSFARTFKSLNHRIGRIHIQHI